MNGAHNRLALALATVAALKPPAGSGCITAATVDFLRGLGYQCRLTPCALKIVGFAGGRQVDDLQISARPAATGASGRPSRQNRGSGRPNTR